MTRIFGREKLIFNVLDNRTGNATVLINLPAGRPVEQETRFSNLISTNTQCDRMHFRVLHSIDRIRFKILCDEEHTIHLFHFVFLRRFSPFSKIKQHIL